MSKSQGTFYTARDVFQGKIQGDDGQIPKLLKPIAPEVLRYALISSHYRDNMNFTHKGLLDAGNNVRKLIEFRKGLEEKTNGKAAEVDLNHPVVKEFSEALADDLNMAGALGVVHPWVKSDHADPHEALGVWMMINSVLSIAPLNEGIDGAEVVDAAGGADGLAEAESLCKELDQARADKDYAAADAIRDKIKELGFEVRTTGEGTTIQKELI